MSESGATWAGTHTFSAPHFLVAGSVDEAADAVRAAAVRGQHVRALGTRHSFHDLADSSGVLVTLTSLDPSPVLDEAGRTVTVGGGTRYGVLAAWLEARGWALHNLGSLPHISIAGATQTGTHGSGVSNGNLSTAVLALEFIDATGELQTVRRGDRDFAALAVGLGAFGIITRITLNIEPTYEVCQDVVRGIPWDAFLDDPDAILAAAYSVSVFTRWGEPTLEQVWVKSRIGRDHVHGESSSTSSPGATPATSPGTSPATFPFGGELLAGPTTLVDGDPADLTDQGSAGPWLHRLPHFRLDGTPSNGDEIQTEYFVARSDAAAALAAVRELAPSIDPLLMITELRTVAADDLWLSGAYGRDTLAIHFTWRNLPQPVAGVLPLVESALAPFDPRPHWGKWHAFDAQRIAAAFPRLPEARAAFEARDPSGMFVNNHLTRLAVR